MKYNGETFELKAIETVAALMIAAAKTAPKGCGQDCLETFVIDGDEKDALAEEMRRFGEETNQAFYVRDSENVKNAACVVLFGALDTYRGLPHFGYCGMADCSATHKAGARCAFNITDLGIAMGSAVSVAAAHHIDNRIMFSAGNSALAIKLFSGKVSVAYGVPLSITEKSPFFDRMPVPSASAGCK